MKFSAKIIAIVLLFVGLVLVNYLASQLPLRGDATAENIYTLSDGTRSLLSKIEEPVSLDLYYSRNVAGLPITYKNYADRVEEMLRQYTRASRGKVVLNVIRPEPDTPEEEQATLAGLQAQVIPTTREQFFFGLVATQADQQKAIAALNPNREQFLEYDLSQLIYSVQQFDKRRLGLLTTVPLKAPPFNPMMMQQGRMPEDQFVVSEWQRTFDIIDVEPTATELMRSDGSDRRRRQASRCGALSGACGRPAEFDSEDTRRGVVRLVLGVQHEAGVADGVQQPGAQRISSAWRRRFIAQYDASARRKQLAKRGAGCLGLGPYQVHVHRDNQRELRGREVRAGGLEGHMVNLRCPRQLRQTHRCTAHLQRGAVDAYQCSVRAPEGEQFE